MVDNEHQQENSITRSHFDKQENQAAILLQLDAMRTTVTRLLASQKPQERRIALEEMDESLLLVEKWAHETGELTNTIQAEIAKMKVQRNAALPIHALPRELLTAIFLICLKPITWSIHDILRLMSVCSTWKRFLESSALFWPKLHSKYSLPIVELVLRRNPSGPLRVVSPDEEAASKKSDVLGLAAEYSTRWCAIAFKGVVSNTVKEQLQVPTPNLTELQVINYGLPQFPSITLNLSEGKKFHHVVLSGVTIPWDSSRLLGLRSLQLCKVTHNSPSLSQLHTVLVSSPELWYLRLSELTEPSDDAASILGPPPTLFLPELSALVLYMIPEHFMVHLLTHIQAPVCSCIVAANIPFSITANSGFQTLITQALRVSNGVRITSSCASLFLASEQRPRVPINWAHSFKKTVGMDIKIRRGESGAAWKEDIQSVLNVVTVHAPSNLAVGFIPSSSALPITTASELLRLLPTTKAIRCYRLFDCHDVLQYLVVEDGSGPGFPCPDLETLMLRPKDDTEVELLRCLLRLRQLSSQKIDSSVRPLKRLSAPQSVLDMLNMDGLLEGLETEPVSETDE
ncbi:hypothetical protein FRC04_005201 [Tulasnella sp. 424]|nr:hypothetical protein FRC04_005201 [Tulasnella sp. 424]